jgi:hypothetical protein
MLQINKYINEHNKYQYQYKCIFNKDIFNFNNMKKKNVTLLKFVFKINILHIIYIKIFLGRLS